MVSVEPGESSSSPRDNIFIQSVKKSAVGPFDHIELSDGSSFYIHPFFPPPFPCDEGLSLEAEELETLALASETGKAWEKALDLLDRRNHSRQELRLKLQKKGFSHPAAQAALSRLEERHLVDDRVFAEQWVLSRLSLHPEGRFALFAGLRKKGVAGDTAEEVLRRIYTEEAALDAVTRVCEKARRRGLTEEDISTLLAKKGFSRHILQLFRSED